MSCAARAAPAPLRSRGKEPAQQAAAAHDGSLMQVLEKGKRTYTFCGTPGYVAPENVIAQVCARSAGGLLGCSPGPGPRMHSAAPAERPVLGLSTAAQWLRGRGLGGALVHGRGSTWWVRCRATTAAWTGGGLGVLLYVLLTGRQPFSSPKTVRWPPGCSCLEQSQGTLEQ